MVGYLCSAKRRLPEADELVGYALLHRAIRTFQGEGKTILSLGLSPLLVHEVFKGLRELKESGLSILLVEQNALAALKFSDRTYVLEHGRVTLKGDSKALAGDARVREAYLGRA